MKTFSIILTVCSLSSIFCIDFESVVTKEFEIFKMTHDKVYKNAEEELHRLKTFAENKKVIAEHNVRFHAGKETFEMGLNQFSDMTTEEFTSTMLGNETSEIDDLDEEVFNGDGIEGLPTSYDWRDYGAVNRVKNQGQCGSCWAFSTAAALESHNSLKYGRLISLSEQNLLDCAEENGCKSGSRFKAFRYVQYNGGIDTEQSYPYEAKVGPCRFTKENIGGFCKGYTRLPFGNEAALQKALYNVGPITVGVNASPKFMKYRTGIFYDDECTGNIDHSLLLIGYGQDSKGNEYWILKNSWAETWGEKGYMKLAKNRNNLCHIASRAIIPQV